MDHAGGRREAAAEALRQATGPAIKQDFRTSEELAVTLVAHTALLAGGDRAEPAAYLLGAATALLQGSNRTEPRSFRITVASTAQWCRAELGEDRYAQAFAAGTRFTAAALTATLTAAFDATAAAQRPRPLSSARTASGAAEGAAIRNRPRSA